MKRTQKATRIIKAAMMGGCSHLEAAALAQARTGLTIIPSGPAVYLRWGFFLIDKDGKRVLRYHRLFTRERTW